MILDFKTVHTVTCGAAFLEEKDDGIHFYRLNREQLAYYKENSCAAYEQYHKSKTASGIKLQFKTNSSFLKLSFTVKKITTRSYSVVEVFTDGNKIGETKNFPEEELTGNYCCNEYPCGSQVAFFDLGPGEKTVCIYLPRLVKVILQGVELEDGASVNPIKAPKKLLAFGDSITQGYDCVRPTSHYVHQLCQVLNADEYNKGIGGEQHTPFLVEHTENFIPDYITVSYGTNDWRHGTVEDFLRRCKSFYENLSKYYPSVPVITITPIWRGDLKEAQKEVPFGPIHKIEQYIREITAPYSNVTVVRGYEFIPEDPKMFGDLRLHPNDNGFAYYGRRLIDALK